MTNPQVIETNVSVSNSSQDAEKVYLCEYQFRGELWSLTLHANSLEEAQQKVRSVGYGKVLGEVALEIKIGKVRQNKLKGKFVRAVKKIFTP